MQFLKGPKLVDGIRENGREYAKSIGKTLEQLEKEILKDFDQHGLPPVYNGPSSFQLETYRTALKLKDFVVNVPILTLNAALCVLHIFTGLAFFKNKFQYAMSFIPLNSSYIMDT